MLLSVNLAKMIHVKIILLTSFSGTKERGIASGLVGTVIESTYVVGILRQPIIAPTLAPHQAALHLYEMRQSMHL
jgi:hypothetical protein